MIFSWQYAFLFLAGGIAVGARWAEPWWVVVVGVVVILTLGRLMDRFYQGLFIAGFLLLGLLLSWRLLPPPPPLEPYSTSLTGVVRQLSVRETDYQQTILRCADRGYYRNVVLYLPLEARVKSGDTIRVEGKLSTLRGARNPGDPDRRKIKAYQHLYYQFKADPDGVQIRKPAPIAYRQDWYDAFASQANRWMTPRPASILTSVIWGDAAALDDEDYRLFQEIGLLHIFAASGMNVGCLMLAAALLTGLFSRRRGLEIGVGLILTVLYAALIGWPVSISRAALMALFASLAYLGGRRLQIQESLFLAAALLLVIDPGWLFTPGFQLTVAATWGLIILYPALANWWFPERKPRWHYFVLPVLAAELAVWPLTVYYFNLVAPVSLLANLVLAPLISLLIVLGTLALFTCPLPFVAIIFWLPCRYLLDLIMSATNFLHGLAGGHWWVKSPPLLLIIACFLLLWWIARGVDYPRYRQIAAGILIVIIAAFSWPRVPGGKLTVTFLDVGQGDGIHISTPGGRQVLIDGGGSAAYPVGRMVVLPYLHRQGVNRLDLVINTHPDHDHWLGLQEVLQSMPCSQIAYPRALQDHPVIQEAFLSWGQGVKLLETGDHIRLDGETVLDVLSPDRDSAGDVNNRSLVLRLGHEQVRIMLMGDTEGPVARTLLARGLPSAEVIKIGHHGSARSSAPEFYQALQPRLAIISVGKNNLYGHPSPLLLQELADQGIKVLRTDLSGGIQLVARQDRLEVYTYARN